MSYPQQTPSEASGEVSKLSYEEYISSSKWRRRRTAYFRNHSRVCRKCGTSQDIHLHHHTYRRMGAELDVDLVPLCQACHTAVHHLHQKADGWSLTRATAEFLGVGVNELKILPKKKRPAATRTRHGHITAKQAAKILEIHESQLCEPHLQKTKRGRAYYRESTIRNWADGRADPPRWLIEARRVDIKTIRPPLTARQQKILGVGLLDELPERYRPTPLLP